MHQLESSGAPPAADTQAAPAAAIEYLQQCRGAGRSFAILTGSEPAAIRLALQGFTAALPATTRIARTLAPTDSSHAFLEGLLAQFGFEPFEAPADDLLRLLTVVLRQGASQRIGTVVIISDAQDFGPRVLETIRELARNARDSTDSPLFILTGHAGLNRVLDSQGMSGVADLTRERFSFDGATACPPVRTIGSATVTESKGGPRGATLLLTRDRQVIGRFPIDRDRMLIGRSELSDICLDGRFVSRQHALLVRSGDALWLIDLRSTNGTIVNSELIQQRRLEHGDVVSLGNFRLRYDDPAQPARQGRRAREASDSLSETTVMRSLQAFRRDESGHAAMQDSRPSSATGRGAA
jgi:hypothetical protein